MLISDSQMHIALKTGEAGGYCLLPGDPGRCEAIAQYFENPEKVAENREFTTWSGTLCGEKVSVCSTGIGGPSAVIAMEELAAVGAHTFIRVGTCGGLKLEVLSGDVIIATGCIRQEGTSLHYLPVEFPAVADYPVVKALAEGAEKLGFRYHTGVVQSKDSFYGQHDPQRMPVAAELLYKWDAWKKAGALASEMEGAALMIAAAALHVRAGMVLHTVWNQERAAAGLDNPRDFDTEKPIRVAVEALKSLILADKRV